MENMKTILIYDLEGTIITQYAATEITPPVGIPYLILEDYDYNYDNEDYRRIERVDVSVEPHVPVYGPTKKEQEINMMSLEEYKGVRQRENKQKLATFLDTHPLTWIDGLQYGVTQEDQSEMIADKAAYDLKHAIDPTWPLQWHSIKTNCRDFTEEEFLGLMNAIIDFVYPYRQLEMVYKDAIFAAATKEEVTSVCIVYELPEAPEENVIPPAEVEPDEPQVEESAEGDGSDDGGSNNAGDEDLIEPDSNEEAPLE